MLEVLGEFVWLFVGCFGIPVGRYGSKYLSYYLKKRGWRESVPMLVSPFPELTNGMLWGISAILCDGLPEIILSCVLLSVLYGIAVTDHCIYEIPARLNGIIACLGVVRILTDAQNLYSYVLGGVFAGGLLLLVYLVTGRRGIGGGDIKLMAASGLFLGSSWVLYALFFGCVLAVAVELPRKVFGKRNSTFAFGPYLALGIGAMVWFGDKILQWEYLLG